MRDDDAASYPCYYIICHMHTDNLSLAFVYPKTALDDNPSCSKQNKTMQSSLRTTFASTYCDTAEKVTSAASALVARIRPIDILHCIRSHVLHTSIVCIRWLSESHIELHYIQCFADICACYRARDRRRRAYKRDQVHGIVHNRCVPQCLCDTNEHTTNDWTVYVFGILRAYYVIDSRIKNRIMVLYAHVDDANPSEAPIMVLVCDFR